ncbi:MAG: hypothetical protein NF693_01155 [Bombella sp.]|nr:hypothetical protein [Bombella sp.]
MSSQTVTAEGGRVSVTDLPALQAPGQDDRVMGLQNGSVGLFQAGAFMGNHQQPDLSAYATTTALTQAISSEKRERQEALKAEAQARSDADAALSTRVGAVEKRMDALPSGGGTGAPSGGTTAINMIGYYNDGTGFKKKQPTVLFMTVRSGGGAGNQGSLTFPGGIEFLDVPYVRVQGADLNASDFQSGSGITPYDGSAGGSPGWVSVTKTGLTYRHPGGWPGWTTEFMTFVIIGFLKGQ